MASGACGHIESIESLKPMKRVCEECVKIGGRWVHLRTCQECGITRCCDNSPNQHATKHARAQRPPGGGLGRARGALALLLSGRRLRRVLSAGGRRAGTR